MLNSLKQTKSQLVSRAETVFPRLLHRAKCHHMVFPNHIYEQCGAAPRQRFWWTHVTFMIVKVFFFLCPYSITNIQTIEMFFTWNYGMWTVFYFLNLKCKYATNRFIIKTSFFAWTLSVCYVFFSNYVRPLAIPLILISLKRTKSCYFMLQNDKLTREIAYWTRFMIFDAAFYGNASFSAQFMSDLVWHRDSFWRTLNFFAFHTSDEYLIAFLTFVFEQIKSHFHLDFIQRYECYVKLTFQRKFFVPISVFPNSVYIRFGSKSYHRLQ